MVSTQCKLKRVSDSRLAQQTLDILSCDDAKNYVYNRQIAALLASVAGWSYAELEDFQRILTDDKQINLSEAEFKQISATNDSMLIVATSQIIRTSDKKTIIVCFRGTEPMNPVNWGTDLNTKKVYYLDKKKRIKVHQGFMTNFRAVWDGGEGVLAHLLNPSKIGGEEGSPEQGTSEIDEVENIYFTGHSLGAAMAFLAGLYVAQKNNAGHENFSSMWSKVRGIYNYGQPMVIDPVSEEYCTELIGERLFRMVYHNDIVPHVPSVTMGLYAHIGHEYRYRPWPWHGWKKIGWGKVTQLLFALPALPFVAWDAAGGSFMLPFSLFKSPWSLMDHLPTGYINTLHGIDDGDVRGIMPLGRFLPGIAAEEQVVDADEDEEEATVAAGISLATGGMVKVKVPAVPENVPSSVAITA